MKRDLVSAPVLAFPDFHEQFLLYVDASSTGIRFALAQVRDDKEVVIAYNGRGLNQAERNYSTVWWPRGLKHIQRKKTLTKVLETKIALVNQG